MWPLTTLRRWTATATSFALDFGEYALSGYVAQTAEGDTISQLIAGYVDIVRRRREEAAAASADRDGSGMGDRRGSRSGLSASMSVGSSFTPSVVKAPVARSASSHVMSGRYSEWCSHVVPRKRNSRYSTTPSTSSSTSEHLSARKASWTRGG